MPEPTPRRGGPAPEPAGVTPEDVRARLEAGDGPILACAYERDVGFRKYPIPGAISWADLQAELPRLDRETEIVFY